MSEKSSEQIKSRCTTSDKKTIEAYAANHNITVSNLVLASVLAAIDCDQPLNKTDEMNYFYSTVWNITRTKVLNLINLDPSIPAHTKDKIRKELDKIDLSKFNN